MARSRAGAAGVRIPEPSRVTRASLLSWVSLMMGGCPLPAGKLGEVADDTATGGPELPPESERMTVLQLDDGALDILLVIDNSGSMGLHQARTTAAVAGLTSELSTLGGDVRIGITTTDNGNPWCAGTGPEAGQLRLSSCASRTTEFVFQGAQTIDATQEACLDQCGLQTVSISPTPTHVDDTPAARPWIELSPGASNLDGVEPEAALWCAVPQGINGCGFESPLESMRKTLERAASPLDPAYGFVRPWARLAVVFVTDEVDCSVDSAWEEVFLPDGNRAFWSDPEAPAPTSAVCWNAGVQCQSAQGDLGACNPQNYDVEGNVTDASSAVMVSLARYIEVLGGVENSKAAFRPADTVTVAVIAGVPPGYFEGQAELSYTRGSSGDPAFVADFGVDPGCTSAEGQAVPPVRMRAMAELFTLGGDALVSSICADDHSPVLEAITSAWAAPRSETAACIPGCLADVDADASGTQASCEVIMSRAGASERETTFVSACTATASDEPCYRLELDDAASSCAAQGSNARLELVLPEGEPVQGQVTVEVACELAPADRC